MPITAPSSGTSSSIPEVMAFVDVYLAEHQAALAADAQRPSFTQRAHSAWRTLQSLGGFDPYLAMRDAAAEVAPARPALAGRLRRIATRMAME